MHKPLLGIAALKREAWRLELVVLEAKCFPASLAWLLLTVHLHLCLVEANRLVRFVPLLHRDIVLASLKPHKELAVCIVLVSKNH